MYHNSKSHNHINGNMFHHFSFFEFQDILISICHNVHIIHTKTTIIIIISESLFMMCVNSCHATASISDLFSLFINHLENTIHQFFVFHHVANAFRLSSSIIHIFGVCSHLEIHKFSIILYISGFSFLVIGLAQVKLNIICLWKKNDIIHQIIIRGHSRIKTLLVSYSAIFRAWEKNTHSVLLKLAIVIIMLTTKYKNIGKSITKK